MKEITLQAASEFFLNDPELCLLGLHDSDLVALQETKLLQDRSNSKWYKIGNNLATVRMEPKSDTNIFVHVYISSEHRAKGLLRFIYVDIVNYLLNNTKYAIISVPVPKSCTHVLKAVEALNFDLKKVIPKSLTWRNKKVDLLHFEREITHAS